MSFPRLYGEATDVGAWTLVRRFKATTLEKLRLPVPLTGFAAALYRRSDGEHAIAFRGTDKLLGLDLVDDLAVLCGNAALAGSYVAPMMTPIAVACSPPQLLEALNVMNSDGVPHGSRSIYLTGHSLGGALATVVAAAMNQPVVTFDSPGVALLWTSYGKRLYWSRRDDLRMLHVRARFDAVSALTTDNPGKYEVVDLPCRLDVPPLPDPALDMIMSGWAGVTYAISLASEIKRVTLCNHSMSNLLRVIALEPRFRLDLAWLNN